MVDLGRRPQRPTRGTDTRPLLSFGANITGGYLIFVLARSLDSLLLGRVYGPDAVGLYSRAMALLMRPLEQFLSPLSTVFVPLLSRLQSDPSRYRRAFLQINEAIGLAGFFFTGLVLALAYPITLVLLGPEWEQAALIFGGFALAAVYAPLSITANWLFTSQGRGEDLLRSTAALSAFTALSFLIGLPFGAVGVAIPFSVSGLFLRLPLLYHLAGRHGPVTTRDLWRGFLTHVPVWLVVFGCTAGMRRWCSDMSPVLQLAYSVPVGVAVGAGFIALAKAQRSVALDIVRAVRGMLGQDGTGAWFR